VNTTAKSAVFSGQILLERQFLAAQGRTGASVNIPPGKVLVAFPSTDMLNATGAVQAGDHVDIMISLPISGTTRLDAGASNDTQVVPGQNALVSQTTLQNIEVYTVGLWTPPGQQTSDPAAASALKIITFVVDHQEALILKFVKDSGGTIDLAVRSAADNQNVQTDPVTLDYLVDLFGFIGLVPSAAPAQPTP
jgi:pilus assembly protein CpaB